MVHPFGHIPPERKGLYPRQKTLAFRYVAFDINIDDFTLLVVPDDQILHNFFGQKLIAHEIDN